MIRDCSRKMYMLICIFVTTWILQSFGHLLLNYLKVTCVSFIFITDYTCFSITKTQRIWGRTSAIHLSYYLKISRWERMPFVARSVVERILSLTYANMITKWSSRKAISEYVAFNTRCVWGLSPQRSLAIDILSNVISQVRLCVTGYSLADVVLPAATGSH